MTVVLINTIRKEAHLLGFHGRAATHKILITKSNHAARLRRCKARRNCTVDESKQVLWNDESRFNLFGSICLVYAWRTLSVECIVPTVQFGRGEIII